MACQRCGGDNDRTDETWQRLALAESTRIDAPWCRECENQYDRWVRDHAADIVWQTGIGAAVAIVIGMVLPLLGLPPIIGIAGVLLGFSTFMGLRSWGKRRRRRQFLAGALPRAYLPKQT
jgi:Flp pilus assembly protein TadB